MRNASMSLHPSSIFSKNLSPMLAALLSEVEYEARLQERRERIKMRLSFIADLRYV